MSRYSVNSAWLAEGVRSDFQPFQVQVADALDKRTGHVYRDGAYRVVDLRTGKPAKTGKGGTVPFYGELAWAAAQRLANDLWWEARR